MLSKAWFALMLNGLATMLKQIATREFIESKSIFDCYCRRNRG